jgi:4'-phosphopantetheinyl transferase
MLIPGQVTVWRVRLDDPQPDGFPTPSAGEEARADRFHTASVRQRYLRAHRALRAILARVTGAPLDFAATEKGKPYLPAAPELRFSLSRSHGMALIGVALEVDVGVDVERLRPITEYRDIAERFFPPSEAVAFAETPPAAREREFFRRWTRVEAMLKARGVGLYGAGVELEGDWTTGEIDMVDGYESYTGAVAAACGGMRVMVEDL